MGKSKFSIETKLYAVLDYIEGKKSIANIAQELDCGLTVIKIWIRKYRHNGESGLLNPIKNNSYSKIFKEMVVKEYLAGVGSLTDLALKYDIPSPKTLLTWVSLYNSHVEQKNYYPKGEVYMAQSRKTTFEERIEIVNYCLENDNQYKLAAEKYNVSYTQVYQWVNKFIGSGEEGLLDKRGRRKLESQLSEIEQLQRENKRLKHQLQMQERENILLKKVDEIERRQYSQRANWKRNI